MDQPAPRRTWLLVALPVLAAVLSAAALLALLPQSYRATSLVFIGSSVGSTEGDGAVRVALEGEARRLAGIVGSPRVLGTVRSRVVEPGEDYAVAAGVRSGGAVVEIRTRLGSAQRAVDLADVLASRLAAVAGASSAAGSGPALQPAVLGGAEVRPVGGLPRWSWLPLAALLGLGGGCLLLLALRRRRATVRSVADLDDAAGAAVVRSSDLSALHPLVEGRQVIAVVGPTAAGISTTVAIDMARSLSAAGRSVALVDGDLRQGRLTRTLGLNDEPGLADALSGRRSVLDLVQPWGAGGQPLAVVPSGTSPARPGSLLTSGELLHVFRTLAEEAQVVVVDLPPVKEGPEALLLGGRADAIVMVARAGRTTRLEVDAATRALGSMGGSVRAAVLLTGAERERSGARSAIGPVRSGLGGAVAVSASAAVRLSSQARGVAVDLARRSATAVRGGAVTGAAFLARERRAAGSLRGVRQFPPLRRSSSSEVAEIDLLVLQNTPWEPEGPPARRSEPRSHRRRTWFTPRRSTARGSAARFRSRSFDAFAPTDARVPSSPLPRWSRHETEPIVLTARVASRSGDEQPDHPSTWPQVHPAQIFGQLPSGR